MSDNPYLGGRAGAIVAAAEAALDWLAPKRRRSKRVTVPDFTGLLTHDALYEAMRAGVEVHFHPLVEHPLPVEGVVVSQQPVAGSIAKRDSIVQADVRHPTADEA